MNEAKKKQEITRLSAVVQAQAAEFREEIDAIPIGSLASSELRQKLEKLREEVVSSMAEFEITPDELEVLEVMQNTDILVRRAILRRYATLLPKHPKIAPVTFFYEILRAFQGCPRIAYADLKEFYFLAVKALFEHKDFEKNLAGKLNEKMQILGAEGDASLNVERRKIEVFLKEYSDWKSFNPSLGKNKELESYVAELEAVIYLQEQAEVLASGTAEATSELIDFIDYWANYLNSLPPEYQQEKEVVIAAVERCSLLNNEIVERLEQLESAG